MDGNGMLNLLAALHDKSDRKGLPQAVLTVAPHLANVVTATTSDAHIVRTLEICEGFAWESVASHTISYLQLAPMDDPLLHAIWQDILADKFINFEKLFTTINSGFDHDDDVKDFAGSYVLLKKDQANAWKPVESELDWC